MAGFEIKRTELVWPGKYSDSGQRREIERVNLPFQVIERVNESRASREATKERGATLFDVWESDEGDTFDTGWRNKLIWGDNLLVMSSLLEQGYAGKLKIIYIDPPFATGADFSFSVEIGDDAEDVGREQSLIEEKAYRDTWGQGMASWSSMMHDRISLCRELLADTGSIFVHVDWRAAHFVRFILDDVFGADNFRNEIIWHYDYGARPKSMFGRKHDNIAWYSKSDAWDFHPDDVLVPYESGMTEWRYTRGGQVGREMPKGKVPSDVWNIKLNAMSHEHLGYPTQKPEALVERIILATTSAGDLVGDFFLGSGTTAAVAERLGRRWVGCDLGRYSVHVARKRLLAIDDATPFDVLNLGRYERRYWSVATFGEDLDDDGAISLLEYVAFILKLYGATPTTGSQHLHGQTSDAFVHVGAVDSPVTFEEVTVAVAESAAMKASELHILGWEWEMGLNDLVSDEAKKQGVKVVLRQIPREVMEAEAARKGDVQFFELAYLDASVEKTANDGEYRVSLENFVIPNPELVPDDVREKITTWSDYVDYWAVDWDFRDDTFMQGWVTYRTRRDRSLELVSDPHVYDEPGEYRAMIKIIDVFGNDTSKLVTITVD